MIIDKLDNVELYKNIPASVVKFLQNLNPSIELGKHVLSEDVYVNVETYSTKPLSIAKFESHNNYIDIQILLSGEELIYVEDASKLKVDIPYNSQKDITFYSDKLEMAQNVKLDGSNFVMLYPHEAHAPQVSINDKSTKVLKVVVKIRCK